MESGRTVSSPDIQKRHGHRGFHFASRHLSQSPPPWRHTPGFSLCLSLLPACAASAHASGTRPVRRRRSDAHRPRAPRPPRPWGPRHAMVLPKDFGAVFVRLQLVCDPPSARKMLASNGQTQAPQANPVCLTPPFRPPHLVARSLLLRCRCLSKRRRW